MPHDPLDNLVKVGQLKLEPPSDQEVAGLRSSGLARLRDAGNETLSIESRFDLAYNAAHALSLAAGSGAAWSWYIDKLRRAYGLQLILMNALNETYKLLKVSRHFLGAN